MKKFLLLSLLAVAVLAPTVPVQAGGLIVVDDIIIVPPPHPIPFPRPPIIIHPPRPIPHIFAPLELREEKVTVKIDERIAKTTVEQEFHNPNSTVREGTFFFPVPKGAAIQDFQMEIGGKMVKAELLKADKAREIYTSIVRKMQDPALLEYAEQDLFKVRIFPFEAHGKKRIKLTYNQVLRNDAGLVEYTFPLSTAKYSATPIEQLSIKVEIDSSVPIKAIYSPTHEVEVKRDGGKRAVVGLEARGVRPDQNFKLYFSPEQKDVSVNLITHRDGNDDGYFLLLAAPGVDAASKVVEKDVVFVLDTSGSMAGEKLEQAKKAMLFCVENINDGDRFEIIRFATETESVFEKLLPADKSNRSKAREFVKGLKPIGGTAINDALLKALSMRPTEGKRPFVVIFLTDGRPTVGVTGENEILKNVLAKADKTRIFCFGIGTDVNAHLLDKITEGTHASSQYVTPNEDIEVKVSSFYTKINAPVLSDPKLKFPENIRVTALYPNALPDLFKGEELVLVGRFKGEGKGHILLEGTINGKAVQHEFAVTFPAKSDRDFIPRLWATRRVGYLLDEIRLHGEKQELKDEVTELARKYGIVTPYTAYLIIEDEKQRNVPVATRTLSHFERDREVVQQAAEQYNALKADKAGDLAVASARSGQALKEAKNADGFRRSNLEAAQGSLGYGGGAGGAPMRAVAAAPAGPGAHFFGTSPSGGKNGQAGESRVVTQPMQYVAGKNFCQNDRSWVDTDVQKAAKNLQRQRVKFNSEEYFTLLAKEPGCSQWLSLGRNVQFVLNNVLYEVYEDTAKN